MDILHRIIIYFITVLNILSLCLSYQKLVWLKGLEIQIVYEYLFQQHKYRYQFVVVI